MIRRRLRAFRERLEHQTGVVLVLTALLLPVMIGMVGFGVDFGWLFWNGVKIQHGADAAAMAGVVYQPDFRAVSYDEARFSAAENGYDDTAVGTTVDPTDAVEDPAAVGTPQQLRVTITHSVPTFFSRIFGLTSVDITKTAVAEYVQPLKLGSPEAQFGNAPNCTGQSGGGSCPGIWASIQGDINGRGYGDKYSSKCRNWDTRSTPNCRVNNPDYRPSGYIFGIERPAGAPAPTIRLFDPGFNPDGNGTSPIYDRWSAGNNTDGHTVQFTVYGPTPTPLDLTSTTPIGACTRSYGPGDWDSAPQTWETLCTLPDLGPGIYPMQVRVTSTNTVGHNRFSIRATNPGPDLSRVYAIGDFSLYSDQRSNTTAEFFIAEVGPEHEGKKLVLNLWDVGDAQSGAYVQMRRPNGASSWGTTACTWTATRGDTGATWSSPVSGSSTSTCRIQTEFFAGTTTSRYNNSDLRIEIDLTGYTCSTNCWWKVRLFYPGGGTDTTTWEARIEGNPVKLVE